MNYSVDASVIGNDAVDADDHGHDNGVEEGYSFHVIGNQ